MQKTNLQKNNGFTPTPMNIGVSFAGAKRGFTIIETMIAVALFLTVIMIGTDSLLNTTLLQKKSQDMRSIMDNLSFIMEDMSRNIRTGYDFHCSDNLSNFGTPLSCVSGKVLAFKSTSGNQWVYKIDTTDGINFDISKSVDGGSSWTQLNPNEINFSSASGFVVTGAEPPPGNSQQPFATVRLVGTITSANNTVTPFSLQTSVSQRLVDI